MICLMHLLPSSEEISEEVVLAAFRLFWESVLDEVESTEEEDEGNEEAIVLVLFKLFWESIPDEVECTEEVDGIPVEVDQVESVEEPEEVASVSEERVRGKKYPSFEGGVNDDLRGTASFEGGVDNELRGGVDDEIRGTTSFEGGVDDELRGRTVKTLALESDLKEEADRSEGGK
ncbi:uncharacterized protein A4U43_C04F12650 [Asparagus officinalis]|uniref:Uncharacterized protein n=1 Tax=Asparagus officinalis TaxID=4686 RepID=A0A5P1F0V3_ASPOF|nr:uncharacterized protein A4U43_C04F12650 [Asparagus officinalis]